MHYRNTLLFVSRVALAASFVLFVATGLALDPQGGLPQAQLELWNDPAFQKRFTESYIAETEIEPTVTIEEREDMQEILDLISSDLMDKAAQKLEKQLDRDEAASAVFDFTLANIYFQQEKLDRAAEKYRHALEKFPKFRRASKNLGIIYVRKGEFEQAIPFLTRVIELGNQDPLLYGMLGFAYASLGNHLSAESAYRMAILLDPETLDWKMGLARSFFKQARYGEAVALCGQLIESHPDQTDLWLLQANAYVGQNKPLEAAQIFEFLRHMDKATPASLNMLGDIYINEELYALAVGAYSEALEKAPDQEPARAIRASKVLAARGAFEETRQMIETVETQYGEDLDADARKDLLKMRARIAVAQGAGEEEVDILKEIVQLDPLDGDALLLLGQHYRREGDLEQAAFYYERAAGIDDFEADAKVRQAQLLVQQGKYNAALPLLRRAQTISPRESVQEYIEQIERIAKSR